MSKRNVTNIVKVYHQATDAEKIAGGSWYAVAHCEASKLLPNVRKAAAIVVAVSPGLRWERNIEAARRIIAGESLDGLGVRWFAGVRKAERIVRGENPSIVLGGNKVRAFWACIAEPENGVHVCVDGHAYAIWAGKRINLDKTPKMTDKVYRAIAGDYIAAARVVGVLPSQIQAITWVAWRRLHGVSKGE